MTHNYTNKLVRLSYHLTVPYSMCNYGTYGTIFKSFLLFEILARLSHHLTVHTVCAIMFEKFLLFEIFSI